MKISKNMLTLLLCISIPLTFTGCSSSETNSSDSDVVKVNTAESPDVKFDLENLQTFDEVLDAHEFYFEKIFKGEPIKDLDTSKIDLDTILSYSNKASNIASTEENTSDRLSIILKLVELDDLKNHTSDETIQDVLRYIITEFESNQLRKEEDLMQYAYITKYLNLELAEYTNMDDVMDMVSDMYQIVSDSLRGIDSSIEANVDQVNAKINSVKKILEM